MVKHWQYLKYVVRHKWFVLLAGLKLWDVSIWRLILHDWTKFLPREWTPYVNEFYGDDVVETETGYMHVMNPKDNQFNVAWNHHMKKNDHHWQFWIINFDDGGTHILPMSKAARAEMIADWRGAGRAQGKPDTRAWYSANRHTLSKGLHPDTLKYVEMMLHYIPDVIEVAASPAASKVVDPGVVAITSHHWELKGGVPTYSKTPLPDGVTFVADAFDKGGAGWIVNEEQADE